MAPRADKLKKLITDSKRIADQAQKSFLKAEDVLGVIEDRENRRADRTADRLGRRP